PEGHVVKVPGTMIVQAVEIGPDGIKRPLSSWEIDQAHLSRSWRRGLLNTGYVLVLPWKIWPSTEKLRVTVQFRLNDGRLFEPDRAINVRAAPANQRPRPTSDPVGPSPVGPSLPEELPVAPRPAGKGCNEGTEIPGTGHPEGRPVVRPAAEILRPVPAGPIR